MNPRTAYQRCHELQYEQFGSVQGLVDAMREYQRMAPQKLKDETLESILWNKVPVELQQELKEIPDDGSVQVLLQKLLRAEAAVAERKRRSTGQKPKIVRDSDRTPRKPFERPEVEKETKDGCRRTTGPPEMVMKNFKCYKCQKKGHIAKYCPAGTQEDGKVGAVALSDDLGVENVDNDQTLSTEELLWSRVVTEGNSSGGTSEVSNLSLSGPVYKVDVTVDGVKTRALLDHGSQVTIVRRQLLPLIKEKREWSMDTCCSKLKPLKSLPTGASGQQLKAKGIVTMDILVESTGKTCNIPCYIIDSGEPLWSGALKDCAMLMGTNALVAHGFKVSDSGGVEVSPTQKVTHSDSCTRVLTVILQQTVHLKPNQTKLVKGTVQCEGSQDLTSSVWMMSPEEVLREQNCDLPETLFADIDSMIHIPLYNSGSMPVLVKKGLPIGKVEEVSVVGKDDSLWSESEPEIARVSQVSKQGRCEELVSRLQIGKSCTKRQVSQIQELLCKYHDVFALTDSELGDTDIVTHSIDTGNAPPVRASPRRLPYVLRKELEKEMEALLETGCIEPSSSPYSSPLVLVRKKSGGLRVCVDYRAVNKNTVPDRYPIPRIDELMDMVGKRKAKIFSSLDLMKGYHQVRMEEGSKVKTAFTCHLGHYQYQRMPFGLTNAPATFQRLMGKLFGGQNWDFVFVYLDDILVASQSMEEHLSHLEKVAMRIQEAGLRLRPEKCLFATERIEYLGHTLTSSGVQPNDQNVKAVTDFPTPSNLKEVRSFVGMANFYRRHIPKMATLSRPLTELLRHDKDTGKPVPFVWTDDCQKAFENIKEMLTSAPLLHAPEWDKEFFLWTDASLTGFGAVLEQTGTDGKRVPIAYASRMTTTAEKKYGVTELEVAALIYALEHFEVYLLGNQTTVYTDHKALVQSYLPYLKNQQKGMLARWYLRLARFLPTLQLEHKPGSANVVADA